MKHLNEDHDMKILEGLLDKYGVFDLNEKLATICFDKAEHIQTNWQDEPLAKRWEKQASEYQSIHAWV